MSTAVRLLATLMLAAAPVWMAAPARAVRPPPVDSHLLPVPAPAAPRHPTEQVEPCVAPIESRGGALPDRPDLRAAWELTRGAGQTVAVIDTGVTRHRLLPHLIPGGDYVAAGDGTDDCDGHGTIVAGIIGAAPADIGFSGIAPDATILAIRQSSMKFSDPKALGSGVGDVDTLAAAVRSAADQGATVINISSVACLRAADELDDRALGAALAYAVDVKNVVVVVAAGNVGGDGTCPQQNPLSPDWTHVEVVASPSWYDDYVLTVGSVNADGDPSAFTLAGPWVDVAAAGEAVVSLSPSGEGLVDKMPESTEPQVISGTSYAAPVVAAVAALLRSIAPQLTARQVMHRIESTARRPAAGWDPLVGHGLVDMQAALHGIAGRAVVAPRPVVVPTAEPSDTGSGRFALIGAALCVVVAVGSLVVPLGRLRDPIPLRHRRDTVPHD